MSISSNDESDQEFNIPAKSQRESLRIYNEMADFNDEWEGGSTSLNNSLWFNYFIPLTKSALTNLKRGKSYELGLGKVFGLMMYMRDDDMSWLYKQEVWTEEKKFINFFKSFGVACRTLLALSDLELVMDDDFRAFLKKTMQKLQHEINNLLNTLFDSVCQIDMIDMDDFEE